MLKENISWDQLLTPEVSKEYFILLVTRLKERRIYEHQLPPPDKIFRALELCPFNQIRVVILGQDPYHTVGRADGLCFSSNVGVPPSLRNIYKEIQSDLNVKMNLSSGDLTYLAKQGVLLLNTILTVAAGTPGSHMELGWEIFTDFIIKQISKQHECVVFMCWGNLAKQKVSIIDTTKHYVLQAPHPSPFSAHTGYIGCKHFSLCNDYLKSNNIPPINWSNVL